MSEPARSAGRVFGRAIVAMALGGLLFGFDTAVISGVTEALRNGWALSPSELGGAVSAALWGTLVGAVAAGLPGDRFGSLQSLRAIGVLYVVSAVGCALAPDVTGFSAFRFVGGIAIGASSVLAPVYIAEISPAARRGFLVGLFQFNIVLGILLAYLSNFLLGLLIEEPALWRWKLGVAAFPAALFLLLLVGLPHSPRWLMARGHADRARDAASRLGVDVPARVEGEARESRLDWRRHRTPILLAVAVGALNQLSGVNAILYYLNDIFAAGGYAALDADAQAVAIGVANLVATVAAIAMIDRVGRKPLLVGGGVVTAAALAGVALVFSDRAPSFLLLPLLVLFMAAFAMSQGAVIWVYLSEIFPTEVRARGQALGSATHWIANAAISFGFPVVAAADRASPFWVFAAAMVAQAVVVARFFPETRGVALEAMAARVGTDPA